MIRKATLSDLDSVFAIINECKADMLAKGIEQWPSHHPSIERVKDGILKGEHYVIEENEEILGGVRLNNSQDEQYALVKWGVEDSKPLIVHQLAVSPQHQGKGLAKKLMLFAEELAKKQGSKCIRLDTYSINTASNAFYQKLGYKFTGTIKMPQYKEGEYNCYEKRI